MAKSVVPAFISGALLALMMSTTGCSITPKTVTKDEVANQIKQKKWGGAGDEPESVSCPQDLRPTVGATVVCEMTLDGQTYAVDVTVTRIDGDKVELDMRAYR